MEFKTLEKSQYVKSELIRLYNSEKEPSYHYFNLETELSDNEAEQFVTVIGKFPSFFIKFAIIFLKKLNLK